VVNFNHKLEEKEGLKRHSLRESETVGVGNIRDLMVTSTIKNLQKSKLSLVIFVLDVAAVPRVPRKVPFRVVQVVLALDHVYKLVLV
jgi:hypothetical protein